MESNRLKYPKKTKKIVGCVLFSLAAFTAFSDYNDDDGKSNRILSRDEDTDHNTGAIIGSHVDKMNQLQIVVPSVIDETPQQIMTELFSKPEAVMEEKHRKCKATSQVKISFDTSTNGNEAAAILSTFDDDGVEKKEGGDEFYITYHGNGNVQQYWWEPYVPPDAVAHVKDLDNGQYTLELVQPLLPYEAERLERDILPGGIFTVVLQYTCGLGAYMPPTKKTWENGGSINSDWKAQVPPDYLPPITMARNRPMPQSFGKELASYQAIYGIGNSLMRQFMGGFEKYRDHPERTPLRENFDQIHGVRKVLSSGLPLSSSTLDKFIRIAKRLVRDKGIAGDDGKDYALWLGSGVWDLLGNNEEEQPNFDDHLKAVKEWIVAVKGLTSAKIYWKSMTACHIHICRNQRGIDRLRYCSTSRAKMLHDAQMALMKELDIPVFDQYNMTFEAADQTQPGDSRHYSLELNEWMMDYFYPVGKDVGSANGLHLADINAVEVER